MVLSPFNADVVAGVGPSALIVELLKRGVYAVISHLAGPLEAAERALQLEHFAGQQGIVDTLGMRMKSSQCVHSPCCAGPASGN